MATQNETQKKFVDAMLKKSQQKEETRPDINSGVKLQDIEEATKKAMQVWQKKKVREG